MTNHIPFQKPLDFRISQDEQEPTQYPQDTRPAQIETVSKSN